MRIPHIATIYLHPRVIRSTIPDYIIRLYHSKFSCASVFVLEIAVRYGSCECSEDDELFAFYRYISDTSDGGSVLSTKHHNKFISYVTLGLNGVLGHDSALKGYTGPGKTWANDMNIL